MQFTRIGFLARTTALLLIVLIVILNSHCTISPLTQPPQSTMASFQTMRPRMFQHVNPKFINLLLKHTCHWRRCLVCGHGLPCKQCFYLFPLIFEGIKTCLVQLSTTLPTYQYMLSNYTPTVALVIMWQYITLNQPSSSEHAVRTFDI